MSGRTMRCMPLTLASSTQTSPGPFTRISVTVSRSSHSRNAGKAFQSPRAMPVCSAPCPGNIKMTSRGDSGAVPVMRWEPVVVSRCAAWSTWSATTAARSRKWCRPVNSVNDTSPRSVLWVVSASARRVRVVASSSTDRADTGTSLGRIVGVAMLVGASSSTACALVPPSPKEETAARRGLSDFQVCRVVLT